MKQIKSVLFTAFLLSGLAVAQLTRGFISGTVTDATGAVIADAKITITNKQTGIVRETMSNGVGVYRFVAVEPGTYSVEFGKASFETKRVENIVVNANQEVVINQVLAVASTTTTVEVSEAPPGVELAKATATIERKLDSSVIANVPLTGALRDVNVLALLAPTANRAPGSTGISANGQRARNNNFMVDGVDNNDPSVTIANNRNIPESVAEFSTQVNAYSAEFGRNSGAQIAVITRSGTNQFRGEIWDYYRANWMEPVSLLNKRNGVFKNPRYLQNQAGGSLGGPIIKNKLFFFGLIEANRRREAPDARNSTNATIPTPAGLAALQNVPLGPNQTPQSRQAVLQGLSFLNGVYPQIGNYVNRRNVTVNNVPIEVGTVNIPLANPYDFWYHVNRVDYQASDKDSISYRLLFDKRNQPDVTSNLQFGKQFSAAQAILRQNHALSHTRTFSPRFVNEFRFAYIRAVLDFPENDPVTPTTTITGLFTIGGLSNFPQGRTQNTFQWQNISTYLLGKHSLKFGADIRRLRLFNLAAFNVKGTFNFDNLQDFLNNTAASFTQAVNTASFDARQNNLFFFFQDDYKLTKDLTLNLGLRYEYNSVPFGFFGATDPQSLAAGVPGPTRPDKNNWAPRGALAWSPSAKDGFWGKLLGNGQTVFRGGYGMGYDVLFFNILTVNASNFPRVVTAALDRPQLVNVWPRLLPTSAQPVFDPRATWVNSPEDTQNPTVHFYSFSIQRQFAKNYVAEIGYTGSRSYHGIRQGQLNPGILTAEQAATVRQTGNAGAIPGLPGVSGPANRRLVPAWGSRVTIESTALANYNAMYLKLDKRLSHNLSIGGNYTWSANLSDNDESLGVGDITASSPQVPQDYFNYRNEWGRSAFDVPHRFAFYYAYDVPWFSSAALNNPAFKHIFKGWSVNGFTDFQSGQPFTIRTGVDTRGTGTPAPHRPSYNPGGQFAKDPVTGDLRTFTTPINGTGIVRTFLGPTGLPLANSLAFPLEGDNLGRNTFRGPNRQYWNIAVRKTIDVTERWKVILRADFINAWNTRNFLNPVSTMNSPIFGQNTSDPGTRNMLVSAKIRF
jgi:outer membrane receptor protein involved in Fe transport